MQAQGKLSILDPGEDDFYGFDFTKALATGDSVTSVQSVLFGLADGTDPTPQDHVLDAGTITGNEVVCKLGGFTLGSQVYKYQIFVNTLGGAVLDLWAFVSVGPIVIPEA